MQTTLTSFSPFPHPLCVLPGLINQISHHLQHWFCHQLLGRPKLTWSLGSKEGLISLCESCPVHYFLDKCCNQFLYLEPIYPSSPLNLPTSLIIICICLPFCLSVCHISIICASIYLSLYLPIYCL